MKGPFDSAGLPWEGRELSDAPSDQPDDGRADPALLAVLGGSDADFMAALAGARVLVPIVATTGESSEDLQHGDASAEMSVVTLTAPDGERALPVFSGQETLQAWDAQARPRPVPAAQAAQAAVAEQCDVLVIDLGSPGMRTVRPSMVWALATERGWLPAYADPFVQDAVAVASREDDAVLSADCEGDEQGQLRIVLRLAPDLGSEQIREVCSAVAERLATDGETRARIDALSFKVLPA